MLVHAARAVEHLAREVEAILEAQWEQARRGAHLTVGVCIYVNLKKRFAWGFVAHTQRWGEIESHQRSLQKREHARRRVY